MPFVFLFSFFLASCGHKPLSPTAAQCVEKDWYEIGRQDGRRGDSLKRLKKWKNFCEGFLNQRMYNLGYNKGLKQYCSSENAFHLGKNGAPYKDICRKDLKEEFLKYYKKGAESYLKNERSFIEESDGLTRDLQEGL